jgi:hypothetical protein
MKDKKAQEEMKWTMKTKKREEQRNMAKEEPKFEQ